MPRAPPSVSHSGTHFSSHKSSCPLQAQQQQQSSGKGFFVSAVSLHLTYRHRHCIASARRITRPLPLVASVAVLLPLPHQAPHSKALPRPFGPRVHFVEKSSSGFWPPASYVLRSRKALACLPPRVYVCVPHLGKRVIGIIKEPSTGQDSTGLVYRLGNIKRFARAVMAALRIALSVHDLFGLRVPTSSSTLRETEERLREDLFS